MDADDVSIGALKRENPSFSARVLNSGGRMGI